MSNPPSRTSPVPGQRLLRALPCTALLAALALARPGPGAHAQEQFVLKLGSSAPIGSPWHSHLAAIARHLEGSSGGHLRVKVLAGASLGTDGDVLPRLADGRVQAYAASTVALSSAVPSLAILGAPHVFASGAGARRQLDGALGAAVASVLLDAGLVFGSWSIGEHRMWLSRERPIRRPRDLRGLRLARSGDPMLDALAEALSASQVDVARPLGAKALHDAQVDALDDTLLSAVATGRDRWARHATLDDHAFAPWLLVYSARWFDGLPEQIKEDLTHLPAELLADARRDLDAVRAPLLDRMRAHGVQLHESTKAERRAFGRTARGVSARLARELGPPARHLLKEASR